MPRFFLPPDSWGEDAALRGDEAKHAARVMRVRIGDELTVFDGEGRRAVAVVRSIGSKEVGLELGEVVVTPPPGVEIVLVPAVLKGKAMEWLIQKAVEIGVSGIEVITTEHAVVRPGEGKEEKWRRTALEACKQCGQDRMPRIPAARPLGEWLESETGRGQNLLASLGEGSRSLPEVLDRWERLGRIAYLVGPEGDFTPEEEAACRAAGCQPVGLGPRVLRAETAGIFGISVLNSQYLRDFY